MSGLITAFALLWFTAAVPAQQAPKIDEYKMTTYQAVLVLMGPDWSPTDNPGTQGHRAYVAELLRSGRAVIGGPFAGEGKPQGFYILSGTAADAKATAEADPGVKEGRYAVEVLQWMGPEGWFQKPSDLSQTETIYFGFLVTGSNTAAITPEEQKELMAGHLGHMDGQAKIGKLVLAGPLVKAGTRRGLIGYRVPTMAEAMERASEDPMVKAGRMKPELYAWKVPKGILK
jgi:uncharacterized protein YciI